MPLSEALSGSRYDRVTALFGHAYQNSLLDATHAAGFQLALWEVFNDDGVLDQGSVRVTGNTNVNVKNEAQALLSALSTWTDVGKPYQLAFLENPDYQDYITVAMNVSAIPEPDSYVLLLAGLTMLGWAVKRSRPHH